MVLCFDRRDLIRFYLEQLEWIKNLLWLCLTQACFFRPTQLKLSLFWLTRLKQRWVRQRTLFGTTRLKMMIIWLNWLNEKVFDRVGLKRTLFWPIRHEMVMFWQKRLKQCFNWLGYRKMCLIVFDSNVLSSTRSTEANCVWLCSIKACYVLTDSTWRKIVLDQVWPMRAMLRPTGLKLATSPL